MRTVRKKNNRKIVFFCLDFHLHCERLLRREIVNLPFRFCRFKSGEKALSPKARGAAGVVASRDSSAFFGENVARIPSAFKKDFSASCGPVVD